MITKELLSEIRKYYVLTTYGGEEQDLHRDMQADIQDYFDDINIHELAYLCKAWAIKNNYNIDERTWLSDKEGHPEYENNTPLFDMRVEGIEIGHENHGNCCLYEFKHKQEYTYLNEAIFAACQWILDNKGA